MRQKKLPLGELGRDNFGIEEARHVEGDGIVNGLFVAVLQSGVRVLRERTSSASVRAVRRAGLHVAFEKLAFLQNEGRILPGAHWHVEDWHDGGTDQTGLEVFGLLDDARDVATENGG